MLRTGEAGVSEELNTQKWAMVDANMVDLQEWLSYNDRVCGHSCPN
jgi:hypothetical protein